MTKRKYHNYLLLQEQEYRMPDIVNELPLDEPRTKPKKWDDELLLIQQFIRDLQDYDQPAQARIVRYVSDRFNAVGFGQFCDDRR